MPELKPIPRISLAVETQRCFSCAETESASEFSRTLMLAEIRRLEGELERAHRALQREAHHIDGSDPHRRRGRL